MPSGSPDGRGAAFGGFPLGRETGTTADVVDPPTTRAAPPEALVGCASGACASPSSDAALDVGGIGAASAAGGSALLAPLAAVTRTGPRSTGGWLRRGVRDAKARPSATTTTVAVAPTMAEIGGDVCG